MSVCRVATAAERRMHPLIQRLEQVHRWRAILAPQGVFVSRILRPETRFRLFSMPACTIRITSGQHDIKIVTRGFLSPVGVPKLFRMLLGFGPTGSSSCTTMHSKSAGASRTTMPIATSFAASPDPAAPLDPHVRIIEEADIDAVELTMYAASWPASIRATLAQKIEPQRTSSEAGSTSSP